jgi:hypothetical protein
MSKIKYPQDWMGVSSLGLIVNFGELTKLCKANGLDAGNISYIVDAINTTTLRIIDEIATDKEQL